MQKKIVINQWQYGPMINDLSQLPSLSSFIKITRSLIDDKTLFLCFFMFLLIFSVVYINFTKFAFYGFGPLIKSILRHGQFARWCVWLALLVGPISSLYRPFAGMICAFFLFMVIVWDEMSISWAIFDICKLAVTSINIGGLYLHIFHPWHTDNVP